MVVNRSCQDAIIQNRYDDLPLMVKKGNAGSGSVHRDKTLSDLLQNGDLTLDDAIYYAQNPSAFKLSSSGIIHLE